jgi:HK97 family phage prohead protease
VKAEVLQWSPRDLQLADARQHAVLEIARAMGIDPEDLGVSTTSRTYQNGEQRRLDLTDFTLAAYSLALQQRLSMRDVLPRGYAAKLSFDGFLRSDTKTRMETYKIGREVGAYDDERIARLEDIPSATPSAPAAPAPAPTTNPRQLQEADVPAAAFAAETETVTFDVPEMASTFRVNVEKRTISGLIVPWGKVASNGSARWRFAENSLYWSDPSRVKLNTNHDHTQAIAKAVRLQPISAGVDASFQVARGAEGDRALSLAEDGVLDGFSVEIYFEDGDGWEPDPSDKSVRLVNRAKLRGVALTAMPAFDDARVSAVAASLTNPNKEKTMTTSTVEDKAGEAAQFDLDGYLTKIAETTTESHKKLTEQLGESIGESISAGFKAALENLPSPQDGPQAVRASRFAVTREAPIYSFNGLGHSLVRDAWYAAREREDEAIERLRKYRQQTEEVAKLAQSAMFSQNFAPQTTSTASQIIPPGYRPDLYVPELLRGRPLVGLASRGTIANATPFTVPTFTSSTGATADHVEGTNPSDGSVSFGTKTVTPGAISGRLVLTREIVDSSNPAIDQIALATMRESYNQQTEAKVYTLLNGANGAGGTITSGFVPSGAQASTVVAADSDAGDQALAKHLRQRLAAYPFNRYGSPTGAAINQNVTTRLARAVDTTGRALFPSVGATNSSGLGNAITQGWSVDGLAHIPAWAMTGTAAGDSQVFYVNQSDLWVWESPLLTFRFEEKQGPANIEMNVFGYFGTHLLRPVGLSGVRVTLA